MFGQTGFRFINAPTFIPAYLLMLSGGSNFTVGLALSLQGLGQMITPLVSANLISHRKRVLPIAFVTGSLMRSCVLLMGLAGFFLETDDLLVALILLLTLFGLMEGMQGVIFNYLMSKVIPVSKRGRLMGLRNFLAGITSAAVAYIGGTYLIGIESSVEGYSWTFVLAFVLTACGLMMLFWVREPEPPGVKKQVSLRQQLRDVPVLLKTEPAFRRFITARSIATMGRMAMPFYILYAGQTIGLSGETLGLITFAFTMSGTVSNLIWGVIADARGFRLVLLITSVIWILSTLLLMLSATLVMTIIVFIGIGASVQGFEIGARSIVLEFGDRANLPIRIALANTVSQITGSLGPLIGGVLAAILGYESVFLVSVIFLIAGTGMIFFRIPEPRTQSVL
jgi:MFS family permease